MFIHVSASGQEYTVVSHIHFSNGGYEKCTYDIYCDNDLVAQCDLTGEIPFTVQRYEDSLNADPANS